MIKPLNWSEIKIDKIIFSKILKTNNKYKMAMGLDYTNNLIFITPIFKNTNDSYQYLNNNNNISQIKFSLEPFLGNIEKFFNLIIDIEKMILDKIKITYPNMTLKSIFDSDITSNDLFDIDTTLFFNIKLYYHNKKRLFKFFDKNNNILDNINIKYENQIKFLIDLSDIWIDPDRNRCGINCKLLQAKLYDSIYDMDCLIDNEPNSNNTNIPNIPNINLNLNNNNLINNIPSCPKIDINITEKRNIIPTKQPQKVGFIPDIKTLMSAKNNLKKVN